MQGGEETLYCSSSAKAFLPRCWREEETACLLFYIRIGRRVQDQHMRCAAEIESVGADRSREKQNLRYVIFHKISEGRQRQLPLGLKETQKTHAYTNSLDASRRQPSPP